MSATQAALNELLPLAADTFDKDKVTPGVLGFIVFAALALGVWGLMKSMSRHMDRVNFKEAPERTPAASPAPAPDAPKAAH
ncbi:hypothetical protein [Streptomyces sp. NPDC051567]|uniref:hypothetical protein n=1 Tax=Streptomyces sp. NPDC051567 TaxID=3365660 RepID=UPI00379AA0C0